MYQSGCLKRIAWAFVPQVAASHQAQFGVNLIGQLLKGGIVAAAPGFQQICDFPVQGKIIASMAGFRLRVRLYW